MEDKMTLKQLINSVGDTTIYMQSRYDPVGDGLVELKNWHKAFFGIIYQPVMNLDTLEGGEFVAQLDLPNEIVMALENL